MAIVITAELAMLATLGGLALIFALVTPGGH